MLFLTLLRVPLFVVVRSLTFLSFVFVSRAENIERLIDLILESAEHQNSSLVYGIDVLLTILEPKTST